MNTPSTKMMLASALGVSLLFTACSNEPEDKRDRMQNQMEDVREDMREVDTSDRESFENDRQDILGDLRDLRSDINDDLEDSQKKLAEKDIDAEDRDRHQRLVNELQQQRQVVEDQIQKVENADMNTWNQVRTESSNTMRDAYMYYEREGMQRRRGDNATGTTGTGTGTTGNNTNSNNNTNVEVEGPAVDINDKDNNARTND